MSKKLLAIAIEDALETEKILRTSEVSWNKGDFASLNNKLSLDIENMKKQKEEPVSTGSSDDTSSSDDSSSDSSEPSADIEENLGDDEFSMDEDPVDDTTEEPSAENEPTEDEPKEDKEPEEESKEDKDKEKKDKQKAKEQEKKDKEKEKEEKAKEKDSKDNEATESASVYASQTEELLEKEFSLIAQSLALEDDYYRTSLAHKTWEGMKAIGNIGVVIASALAFVGVNIAWPGIKRLYKVFLYLSAKFIRFSHAGYVKASKLSEEHLNRIKVVEQEIKQAKETLSLVKEKANEAKKTFPDKLDVSFTKEKIISQIVVGDNTNVSDITDTLGKFLTGWYKDISKDIDRDTAAIHQVLQRGPDAVMNPVKVFGDCAIRKGLIPDKRETFPRPNGLVSNYRYKETLAGNMAYHALLPNGECETIEDIRQAYSSSTTGFVIDLSTFKKYESIDYLNIDEVEKLISSLEVLVSTLKDQEKLYKDIAKDKQSYLRSFKRYMLMVADTNKRISTEKTLLEYIYLRNAFIDDVYVNTARDIHTFSLKYIRASLVYLRENMQALAE